MNESTYCYNALPSKKTCSAGAKDVLGDGHWRLREPLNFSANIEDASIFDDLVATGATTLLVVGPPVHALHRPAASYEPRCRAYEHGC